MKFAYERWIQYKLKNTASSIDLPAEFPKNYFVDVSVSEEDEDFLIFSLILFNIPIPFCINPIDTFSSLRDAPKRAARISEEWTFSNMLLWICPDTSAL